MKKIITLIMMFVLSVSFLMAQGVFTYQTVVVDNQGILVANTQVAGTVTITDGSHTYSQDFRGLTTSPNGLLTLSLGDKSNPDFKAMNWRNAQVSVNYDANFSNAQDYTDIIPAVPYAFQAGSRELTTEMIVNYLTAPNTGEYDVNVIWNAIQQHPDFDQAIAALVDSVKDNRLAAKEIFLYYMEHAQVYDAQVLYNALLQGMENEGVKNAMMGVAKDLIDQNKEKIYDVLSAYSTMLTANDVNRLIDAVPAEVIDTLVEIAVEYLKDPDHFATFLDVFGDYLKNVTVPEVDQLISALQNNPPVYAVMLEQFYKWMDEYVAKVAADLYYSKTCGEGDNVRTITTDELCALVNPPAPVCLTAPEQLTLNQEDSENEFYYAIIEYGGAEHIESSYISNFKLLYYPINPTTNPEIGNEPIQKDLSTNYISINPSNFNVTITIPADLIDTYYYQFANIDQAQGECFININFSSDIDCLEEDKNFSIRLIYSN